MSKAMPTDRRNFLKGAGTGAGLATGLGAMPLGASAAMGEGAVQADFGPMNGQALLSRNENPYGPAPSAIKAITENARMGCYYTDRALKRLHAMIAERHEVPIEQVVVGSGSTEILCAISLAWGRDGAILCPDLFWDTTVKYGERQGVTSIRVPLSSDMNVDLAGLEAGLTEEVSLIQICNPNNPTGVLIPASDLRAFAAKVSPKATLLVDEAYNELTDAPDDNTMIDMVRGGADLIVCRTFSKIYGMAGLRVGYAITSEQNAERIRSHMMSFGGNLGGVAAAIGCYNDLAFLDQSRAMVLEGRKMIMDAVKTAGLTALPSQTNFVYVEVPDADAVQAAMKERGISIRGAYGKWTQYSRVSTGKLADVERYAKALPEVISSLNA
ncbi:MAG: aminotransferase class I/II-fold pyridoxal phosphate-dependent enzyme [Erythrobacter sp.]|uniref:pyridoxal phosphate-dependent aminotransferase n=1 Tax=Erythrobacter sp. TaxID=1042 RepID=UPI00261818C4|nr:aminotransferase class I/II-fold pyridoxal phosphate-dependent enzyme [Erythrobacter sp.]MDJ0979678.1 aminotransferase class I/II-fold pyridoxal phosphate-dependent enzyme [Erythrobacter sp.]